MIPMFIKSYQAATVIAAYRIVGFADGAADTTVEMTSANTDAAIGMADEMGADIGGQCDIHLAGLALVELGATVAAGQPLMSDATGRAIPAVAAASSTRHVIGIAHAPGVVGDIIDVWLAPSLLDRA